jgi:hypothetical protein
LIQNIGDSSERSRVAVTLFGEAGSKLNQALAAGDFEKFLKFTEKFGVKTGPEASKSAANFQVAISAMTLSFDGMLQKFTQSTGLIDKVTDQLINIGAVFAFVGSLIESFSKEIGTMSEAFERDFKVIMDILGVFVDLIIETVDSLTPMGGAFEKAFADAEEFIAGMEEFKKTLVTVNSASADTEDAIENIGDAAKNAKKEVRDFADVVNDLLSSFVKLNIGKILSDIQIVFKTFDTDLGLTLLNISKAIDTITTKIGLMPKKIPFEPQTLADLERMRKGLLGEEGSVIRVGLIPSLTKTAKIFDNKMGEILRNFVSRIQDSIETLASGLLQGFDNDSLFKKFEVKFKKVMKGASEDGLFGAFKALGRGGKIASVFGAAIFGAIKIAEGLGQRGSTVAEIEKSVEQDIRARAKAIELGLQALPRILFQVLPPLFVEFADRVVFGLFKGLAEFVRQIIDGIKSIFTREGRQNLGKNIKEGLKEGFDEFFRRVNVVGSILSGGSKRGGGRFIPSARGGIKFTGADEGLAMLHRGEFVVPETGQMPQAVQRTMGMGQGGMTININAAVVESNAVDELVRQIERRFQTFGSSTSPLFGGR